MSDPTRGTARLQELVTECREARAQRKRIVAAGEDPTAVDALLARLHHDVGCAFVAAIEAGEAVLPLPPPLDYELEEREPTWYTEDPLPPGSPPEPSDPLFDPEDLEFAGSDLDETTPVMPPEREHFLERPGSVADEPSDFVVASIATYSLQRREVRGSPFAQLANGGEPTWKHRLDDLLGLLILPTSFADADDLAVEASRVQWATNDLELRLLGFPAEIQVAVVAMLAARAQLLRSRLDLDVGPRMSLDRLQRYRIDQDLPAIAGLLPTPRPEQGTWEEDARQWWALLGSSS
jgi:hypothetical protein